MKIVKSFSIIFIIILANSVMAQDGIKRIREVSIITDTTKIVAEIWMPEHHAKKLKTDVYYAWYYRQSIHFTEGDFTGQVLHGEYKLFSKSGNLLIKGYYQKGLKNNTWKYWSLNGDLIKTSEYKNGYQTGYEIIHIENTKELEVRTFKKGKLHNKTNKFNDGVLVSSTQYKNGTIKKTVYYKNGVRIKNTKKGILRSFFLRKKDKNNRNESSSL